MQLQPTPAANCAGVFHAHFTLQDGAVANLEDLPSGTKVTLIDLERDTARQRDVMLTRYYRGGLEVRESILQAVKRDVGRMAEASGVPVIRAKLEFMGQFDCELTPLNYLEAHIKCQIPEGLFLQEREKLAQLGVQYDFRLSSNPRERKAGVVAQFANIRVRTGAANAARERISRLTEVLKTSGFDVAGVHVELNVWDSNVQRDAWWA
ncbi:fumarate hydratase class I [Novimethylophilus kurashikiensis]|uniref:Fumarate hydratase class I n=1 Tax=Novimethylophilus kurashikiensis TaxID=1825523 RepID=A0A2R5F9K3_9PROT|nr:hypothetical protein [Novimethylophilus kurashikiensis]GBG14877.1 fumarate hydratase class I [Novimethylophilus kurashikiensis]